MLLVLHVLNKFHHIRLHVASGLCTKLVHHHANHCAHGLFQVRASVAQVVHRLFEQGFCLGVGVLEVLVAPVERTGISSASTITIAVPSSDVPGMLSASAEGSLRLVVPADDVEAVVEGVVAAPSVVSAEGGEAA